MNLTENESFRYAVTFSSLLVLLTMAMGVHVSLIRMRLKVWLGDGDDKRLRAAIRAHGNQAEHVPLLIFMLLALALLGANATGVLVLGIVSVLARSGHAGAKLGRNKMLSVVCATITYVLETAMPIWALVIVSSSASV
jgi:hypothetical protein